MGSKRASWGVLVLSVGAVCGLSATASADTIYVPGDFGTIQAAVNNARSGDTILVDSGTYRENVVVSGYSSTGVHIYANGTAVIEGQGASPALTVKNTWGVGVHGFTIHSGGDGVLVSKVADVVFDGMTVDGTKGDGFHVDRSQSVGLCSNAVTDAGGDGIEIGDSSDVTIDETDVSGTAESGVEITDASGVTMYSNTVQDSGGDGVKIVGGGNVSVCSNSIAGCGESGIDASDTSELVLDENEVDDVVADGVMVRDTAGVGILNNSFGSHDASSAVGGDGIRVESSGGVRLQLNFVADAAGDGISVTDSGAHVEDNVLLDVGAAGIVVTTDGNESYVGGNEVRRPGGSGIVVEGSANTIGSNTIDHAGVDGIMVHGASSGILGNTILAPRNDGLCVTNAAADAGVLIDGNRIARAGDDGVDLGATSNSDISLNTITRARDNGIELQTGSGNEFAENRANRSRGFDLFEGVDPAANTVDDTNKFKKANQRGRARRPHRRHR